MVHQAGAPGEKDFGVIGFLFGELLQDRKRFQMMVLAEKFHRKLALGIVGRVGGLGLRVAVLGCEPA